MKEKDILNVISDLNELILLPNTNFDGNIRFFSYTKTTISTEKPKYFPSIAITGFDTIRKYDELFRKLYYFYAKKITISFKNFQESLQNLFFENNFNEEGIKKLLHSYKEFESFSLAKIYGVSLEQDYIKLGKYIFVRKEKFLII